MDAPAVPRFCDEFSVWTVKKRLALYGHTDALQATSDALVHRTVDQASLI
jgi:hypothetical protein